MKLAAIPVIGLDPRFLERELQSRERELDVPRKLLAAAFSSSSGASGERSSYSSSAGLTRSHYAT